MGGIATDVDGRTSIPGLWAAGEVASTGLHGANRLASNSLLEAVVIGDRVANDIRQAATRHTATHTFIDPIEIATDIETRSRHLAALRRVMFDHVGVIRNADGLTSALETLGEIERAATGDIMLENMVLTARIIATGALSRRESRGGHWRSDYPEAHPDLAHRSFVRVSPTGVIEPVTTPASTRSMAQARPLAAAL